MILTKGGGANLYLICSVIMSPIATPEVKEGNKLKNKALGWLIRPVKSLANDQQGVTGLETAIILIAFVVVASVFAFTVLSTGIFSAERGKETIHAGLSQARSSVELKGSIVSTGVRDITLSNADELDTAWTAFTSTNTPVVIDDAVDKKEGTDSVDITMVTAFTTGMAAFDNLAATVDLRSTDSIRLWVKSSITTTADDLELRVSDVAGCATGLEDIPLPVLVLDTWNLIDLAIVTNSDMGAIKCVGLNVAA
ncbi:MAG: hypothetical protein IIC24_06195, partial [Chloroflexi bacterium]|nr:hypothetical protein [Chloroflexota bacterium]